MTGLSVARRIVFTAGEILRSPEKSRARLFYDVALSRPAARAGDLRMTPVWDCDVEDAGWKPPLRKKGQADPSSLSSTCRHVLD